MITDTIIRAELKKSSRLNLNKKRESSATRNTLRILIVSHVNPILRSAGNEIRIYKMIKWLRSKGVEVILLLNEIKISEQMKIELLDLVNAVYTSSQFRESIFTNIFKRKIFQKANRLIGIKKKEISQKEKIRNYFSSSRLIKSCNYLCRIYKVETVIVEYAFTTPCLRKISSNILKIVDTHDMFSKRNIDDPFYCSIEEERRLLLNADIVLAIQKDEAKEFSKIVIDRKVITVGIDYEVVDSGHVDEANKNCVLVVGSKYPANISGLNEFLDKAWPMVCKENPKAILTVAGRIGEEIKQNVPNVKILGWVDNLKPLYEKSAVVINPTKIGTGLKIKTVEAICHGKAIVATPNAVEGLDFKEEIPFVVKDNWQGFAEAILMLISSDGKRNIIQEAAIRYANKNFCSTNVYSELDKILFNT